MSARALILNLAGVCLLPALVHGQATQRNIATDVTDSLNLADTEPSIAVNPLNPLQIAVVTFSENWGPGGIRAPIWMSDDGGVTWRKDFLIGEPVAGMPGPGDQKLAFDSLGNLHVVQLGLGATPNNFIYRPVAGGLAAGAAFGDDQPHLEISRSNVDGCGSRAYSPWLNFGVARPRSTVTRSDDAGVTTNDEAVGNTTSFPNRTTRVAVAPTGEVYIVYKTREGAAGGMFENAHFRVSRSDDCGDNWDANGAGAVSVHGAAAVQTFFTSSWGNAAKGKVARARSSDAWIAVDPGDGDVYVAFVDQDASGFGQIFVARSTDRGVTWTTSRVTDGANHSAFPEVAVTDNGTVGVLYIDFDDSGAATVFRHKFARSFNDGGTWSRQTLQSMDPQPLANAASGFLWGDYEGLTASGNRFYGVYTGEASGRTTAQLDPIFFTETGSRPFAVDLCRRRPNICGSIVMNPNLIRIKCVIVPCFVIDPLPRNCLVKFSCPGCPPGALCDWYQVFIDIRDPIRSVALYRPDGTPATYHQTRVPGGVVISFLPEEQLRDKGPVGDYFFVFELSERARRNREYRVGMRLDVGKGPYRHVPRRPLGRAGLPNN